MAVEPGEAVPCAFGVGGPLLSPARARAVPVAAPVTERAITAAEGFGLARVGWRRAVGSLTCGVQASGFVSLHR